jgi:uncharacterized protein (DUF302 family)
LRTLKGIGTNRRARAASSATEGKPMPDNTAASELADEVVTKLSPWSVSDTVARLTAVVAAQGMKLFAVIDHSGEAAARGLELRDTKVVFFGSPGTDLRVIAAEPLAALDLPLKVAVWLDGHQTKISYIAPAALISRHNLGQELAKNLASIGPLTATVIDR